MVVSPCRFFKRYTWCLVFVLILPPLMESGYAQTFPFTNYSVNDGLASSLLYSIGQDRTGYLWLGTEAGISLFDGTTFHDLPIHDPHFNGFIQCMLYDSRGRMWIGTKSGFFCLEKTNSWSVKWKGLNRISIQAMEEDDHGAIWFGTPSGVYSYKNNRLDHANFFTSLSVKAIHCDGNGTLWFGTREGIVVETPPNSKKISSGELPKQYSVSDITEDREGCLWFATSEGLAQYNGRSWNFFTTQDGLFRSHIQSVHADSRNAIWCGTAKGLARFDGEFWQTFKIEQGLPNNDILTIFEDAEGVLWFGTRYGLSKLPHLALPYLNTAHGLPAKTVFAIHQDREGNYWFGTYGGGLGKYDGKTWTTYTEEDGLPFNWVNSIEEDRNGYLWISTRRGLCRFDGQTFTVPNHECPISKTVIHTSYQDNQEQLWFGSSKGICKYDGKTWQSLAQENGLIHNEVLAMAQDNKGTLWIGTQHGLTRYNRGRWAPFSLHQDSSCTILTIFEDASGNMWFGTQNSGVFQYDGKTVTQYLPQNGLPDRTVYSITQLDKDMYFGTNNGIVRYNGDSFVTYTVHDGLPTNEMCRGACYVDRKGDAWFGTVNGVVRLNANLLPEKQIPPQIHITDARLLADKQTVENKGILKPIQNYIKFNYCGINTSNPHNLAYAYRLNGVDKTWHRTKEQSVIYPNLPSGQFTFQVKAQNQSGMWSEQTASFHFTIQQAFLDSWLFKGLVLFGFLGFMAFLFYFITRLRYERKLEELIEQRTAELQILRGIIPICSHCKKIRNDEGYWETVENYITQHSEAYFSHGICPVCLQKHYPKYAAKKEESLINLPQGREGDQEE